ncbi:MAG: thiamine phosphate synthase [Candidatus Eremiobacteraeota bacterium]|nr:thiamine phosphate synthase [Candidatus Eremiobacteraeota bacterium]
MSVAGGSSGNAGSHATSAGSADTVRLAGIYGIVDTAVTVDPLVLVDVMLEAGIRVLQYRAKGGIRRDVLGGMLERTRACGAALIVNDDLDAALEADGWHAGQEDLAHRDVRAVRARLGKRLFGVSCATAAEARAAEASGADYVGVGPFAATASKADAGAAIGVAGVAAVVLATRLPVIAIGGIDLGNEAQVRASGAAMAAIISAIACAPDRGAAARALVARWGT